MRCGNKKLQSKEQKAKETERRLKLDTQKKYLKEHGNEKLLQMT